MNKVIRYVIVAMLAVMPTMGITASAETGTEAAALEKILPNYVEWSNVEFSGKLEYSKLPLKPTVKIYMEKNSLIQISLRAPLVGEVGRIEVDQDSILAINKMGKTYCRESMKGIDEFIPNAIGYVQNFLLGRVSVLGSGELSASNAGAMTFLDTENGGWVLYPTSCAEEGCDTANYGYVVAANGRTTAMLINILVKKITSSAEYVYSDNSVDININVTLPSSKEIAATLDFESVKWGGTKMTSVNINSKYKKLSLKEFVKSF